MTSCAPNVRLTTFVDQSVNVIPELAESWSYPDPNTLVLKLRRGVKFHDGTDFNAQAVKINLERIQDPATKAPWRAKLENIGSVEAVDDYTVKRSLKGPQARKVLPLISIACNHPSTTRRCAKQ